MKHQVEEQILLVYNFLIQAAYKTLKPFWKCEMVAIFKHTPQTTFIPLLSYFEALYQIEKQMHNKLESWICKGKNQTYTYRLMFLQISEYLLCICVKKLSNPENFLMKTKKGNYQTCNL